MRKQVLISVAVASLAIGAASGAFALSLSLSPASGHPGATVAVAGTGFGADEAIDLYFDTTDVLLVLTNDNGNFSSHTFNISANALPGQHWVSAVERDNGKGLQRAFAVTTPWAEFGFNNRGKRYNPYENVISPQNVAQLDQAWVATLGGAVSSSPAVVNGIVYVGSFDKRLYAYNAASGAKLWSSPTAGAVESSPAVANGLVYVGSDDGRVWAFNAGTGAVSWRTLTGGGSVSSPAVAAGIVYAGSSGGQFVALNASSGALKWSANVGSSITSTPAIFGGAVFFGAANGNLYAYNATTGVPLWNESVGAPIYGSPAVANGIVYIGAQAVLYGFKALSGALPFQAGVGGNPACPVTASPSVAKGMIFYAGMYGDGCEEEDPEAWTSQNNLVWSTFIGLYEFESSPAVANGVLYIVGATTGKLFALDTATGAGLWDGGIGDGSDITSSPVISDGMLFVGSNNTSKYLTAFALNGGDNAAYKQRHALPPSFASLHRDFRLKPLR